MTNAERSEKMKVSRKLILGAVAGLAVVGTGAAVAQVPSSRSLQAKKR